jgi:hypothetical protein
MATVATASGQRFSKEATEIWSQVLSPLSDTQLSEALLDVLRAAKESYPIAPGALYQAALGRTRSRTAPEDGEAWKLVRDVVCRGKSASELPDAVREAAEQIGWEQLREMTVTDTWTRRDFLTFYHDAVDRNTRAVFEAFDAIERSPRRESLPESVEKRMIVPPAHADDDGEYVPIGNLREEIARMNKEVQ